MCQVTVRRWSVHAALGTSFPAREQTTAETSMSITVKKIPLRFPLVLRRLKAAALLSFACLASSAVAAESPHCASLEKAQEAVGKGTAIDAGAVPFPARGLCPQSDNAGRPPARRWGVAPHPRPRRRGADSVDARTASLRPDAGAEEAHGLSRAGENGCGRRRDVTASQGQGRVNALPLSGQLLVFHASPFLLASSRDVSGAIVDRR
jgi:hypothetical protein